MTISMSVIFPLQLEGVRAGQYLMIISLMHYTISEDQVLRDTEHKWFYQLETITDLQHL